jgi:hypothetical protein
LIYIPAIILLPSIPTIYTGALGLYGYSRGEFFCFFSEKHKDMDVFIFYTPLAVLSCIAITATIGCFVKIVLFFMNSMKRSTSDDAVGQIERIRSQRRYPSTRNPPSARGQAAERSSHRAAAAAAAAERGATSAAISEGGGGGGGVSGSDEKDGVKDMETVSYHSSRSNNTSRTVPRLPAIDDNRSSSRAAAAGGGTVNSARSAVAGASAAAGISTGTGFNSQRRAPIADRQQNNSKVDGAVNSSSLRQSHLRVSRTPDVSANRIAMIGGGAAGAADSHGKQQMVISDGEAKENGLLLYSSQDYNQFVEIGGEQRRQSGVLLIGGGGGTSNGVASVHATSTTIVGDTNKIGGTTTTTMLMAGQMLRGIEEEDADLKSVQKGTSTNGSSRKMSILSGTFSGKFRLFPWSFWSCFCFCFCAKVSNHRRRVRPVNRSSLAGDSDDGASAAGSVGGGSIRNHLSSTANNSAKLLPKLRRRSMSLRGIPWLARQQSSFFDISIRSLFARKMGSVLATPLIVALVCIVPNVYMVSVRIYAYYHREVFQASFQAWTACVLEHFDNISEDSYIHPCGRHPHLRIHPWNKASLCIILATQAVIFAGMVVYSTLMSAGVRSHNDIAKWLHSSITLSNLLELVNCRAWFQWLLRRLRLKNKANANRANLQSETTVYYRIPFLRRHSNASTGFLPHRDSGNTNSIFNRFRRGGGGGGGDNNTTRHAMESRRSSGLSPFSTRVSARSVDPVRNHVTVRRTFQSPTSPTGHLPSYMNNHANSTRLTMRRTGNSSASPSVDNSALPNSRKGSAELCYENLEQLYQQQKRNHQSLEVLEFQQRHNRTQSLLQEPEQDENQQPQFQQQNQLQHKPQRPQEHSTQSPRYQLQPPQEHTNIQQVLSSPLISRNANNCNSRDVGNSNGNGSGIRGSSSGGRGTGGGGGAAGVGSGSGSRGITTAIGSGGGIGSHVYGSVSASGSGSSSHGIPVSPHTSALSPSSIKARESSSRKLFEEQVDADNTPVSCSNI